ncbi:hypothetical protein STENM327S_02943 [Streptomyces tendae]
MDDVAAPSRESDPLSGHQARSGALLDGTLGNLRGAAIAVDDDGLIVAVNSAAQSLLGREASGLVGQDFHDLLHRDRYGHSVPRTRCEIRKALLTGDTRHGDAEWFARGDGTLVRLSWLVTPYAPDPSGAGALTLLYEAERPDVRHSDGGHSAPLTELDRLALLAETTTQLTSTLDVDEALRRLAALTVPRLADWAVFDLLTERDEVRRALVMEHKDGILVERDDLQARCLRYRRSRRCPCHGPCAEPPPPSPVPPPTRVRPTPASRSNSSACSPRTGMHFAVISPIRGLRDVLGAATLGRAQRHARSLLPTYHCWKTSRAGRAWRWTTHSLPAPAQSRRDHATPPAAPTARCQGWR